MASASLHDLTVLVLDCQASGATPVHGDLLELGWARISAAAAPSEPRFEWIKTDRPVSRIIRKLTGWDEAAPSIAAAEAWSRLRAETPGTAVPTVIHFARFELPFLRLLEEPFPLDVICLHQIAERLFPNLPRRNLRALAGHLGGAPEVLRRAGPHVAATALVWRAVVPILAGQGLTSWDDLQTWLSAPISRPRRIAREFPLAAEKRKSLPDAPGVYRFLRPNGDVLYVGKAASLKKRVASHFTAAKSKTHERALEMLSQAHDIEVTPTPTALEAALLEVDEIKRLDPPYNVHLRSADRSAWFATRDWRDTSPALDDTHVIGPLPSKNALAGIAAMRELLEGAELTLPRACTCVGVPSAFAPPLDLFATEWRDFAASELGMPAARRIIEASARITPSESPDDAPAEWDRTTIRRYLERIVVGEGTLVRRAKLLALMSYSRIVFREPKSEERVLVFAHGDAASEPATRPPRLARIASFDAARYDRLRVLATELKRVATTGGSAEIQIGRHRLKI